MLFARGAAPQIVISNLDATDKKVFDKTLEGVELDVKLTSRGCFNAGIYGLNKDYQGHKASEVVVKCMKQIDDETWGQAWGEVKALRTVGYLIDSGLLLVPESGHDKPTPVILMKRIPGCILPETPLWANSQTQTQLVNDIKPKVKEEVINWAVDKNILAR
ncbi:hypothetical protein BDP27DRAFT_1418593 [Rhodocollybia butyracea]|uniref:Uncharacterized protein n=1 Tax=Rhodocollybia butyracea TaxID=206335 RepID=A0A9P5UAH6_9AGAR|nr:hypothetical protein BDP27DRAFT_1418593 [Rhodocollybia butyracea]